MNLDIIKTNADYKYLLSFIDFILSIPKITNGNHLMRTGFTTVVMA